jgi:hypothetical protein
MLTIRVDLPTPVARDVGVAHSLDTVAKLSAVTMEATEPLASDLPLGSSLALTSIPFIFTQDGLLGAGDFIKSAKERGYDLSLAGLQILHNHRLLLPLYRVSDTPVAGRRISVAPYGGSNVLGWTMQAAEDGRLRDCEAEGYSVAWPYEIPEDVDPRAWWNGFVYSSWQLLEVPDVLNEYEWIKLDRLPPSRSRRARRTRQLILALSVLATNYLPGVLGRLSMPMGVEQDGVRKYRSGSDVQALLRLADFDPENLKKEAESLLLGCHNEPLAKWLPLLRYASYKGWSLLRGKPLDSMWRRVAAEVLLRAHEDLAVMGAVEPLPDLTGATWHLPLHDRLTARFPETQTLERALAELGISPHPRVILLVEGETEMEQIPRLLAEFGITQPQQVRVQNTRSSKINAHLIARYGVTPRIGRRLGDRWLLDASPTALVIAMDPENDFATPAMCAEVERKLREAIREEVQYQDADIGEDELDFLVNIHVWGADRYELANFTDNELVPAITTLAARQVNSPVGLPTWEQDLRTELQAARAAHFDIKVPLGKMHVRENKPELAKLLWPVLRAKCEVEAASGTITMPVLKVVLDVVRLVDKMSGVFALVGPAGDGK